MPSREGYEPRWYRNALHSSELKAFILRVKETDLWIAVDPDRYSRQMEKETEKEVERIRDELEAYVCRDPDFLYSLEPHFLHSSAPATACRMAAAAMVAGVGPMAAVAGEVAQQVGQWLTDHHDIQNVIVENGGDIYLRTTVVRRIMLGAGKSPLSNRLALEILPEQTPLGICTSSGTVGHSLSLGKADAVTILAKDAAIADAYATAVGNQVQTGDDIDRALEYVARQPEIIGAVIIVGDRIGFWGDVKLVQGG